MPPPPPRAPDFGPYGKGKVEHEGGKGQKGSASAVWMAGQSGNKVPSGWKNYMVPLIGVPGLNHTTWSHCGCLVLVCVIDMFVGQHGFLTCPLQVV